MQQITLNGVLRDKKGKEFCKKIRQNDQIPAVLYGKGVKSLSLLIDQKEFVKDILAKKAYNAIINLKVKIDKKIDEHLVMLAEVQKDVFHKTVLHIDFKKISLKEKVKVTVPVRLTGEAPGLKEGGILDHILWEVDIEALPLEIPESISLDVGALNIGDSLHVKDLVLPKGVNIVVDPEEIVVIIHAPKAEEEKPAEAVAVEGEAALAAEAPERKEPEVISKGKEKEEKEE